jgi:hypothetical protein
MEKLSNFIVMTNDLAFGFGKPALVFLCAAVIALTGCDQGHYRNTAHPEYGPAQYDKDKEQCKNENSRVITQQANYVEITRIVVDQDKADACVAALGWQRVPN